MFSIQDSSGNLWNVTVTDQGQPETVNTGLGTAVPTFLNDSINVHSYQLTITTLGQLDPVPVALNTSYPTIILVVSSSGFHYNFTISSLGVLVVVPSLTPVPVMTKPFLGIAYLIPLASTPQAFTISLNGITYQFTVRWNWFAAAWIIDIADSSGNPILSGVPMVTGDDLLEQFDHLNIGVQLVAQTNNDVFAVPTFTNLGKQGNLYAIIGATT